MKSSLHSTRKVNYIVIFASKIMDKIFMNTILEKLQLIIEITQSLHQRFLRALWPSQAEQ